MSFEDTLSALLDAKLAPLREQIDALREQLCDGPRAAASPSLLSVAQVASQCQVTGKTVRGWIQSGALAARKAGSRRYVVTQADLERFLTRGAPASSLPSVDGEVSRILGRIGRHG